MANSGFEGNGLLWQLLDSDQQGDLQIVDDDAARQMAEIIKTANEVGGKPTKSRRYNDASAVRYHIGQLRALVTGRYVHTLSSDDV